jgi:putative transposase
MAHIHVQPGTRYVYQHAVWSVKQIRSDQQFQVENLSTGDVQNVSYEDILTAWARGELRFEVRSSNAVQDDDVPLRTRFAENDLASLPERIRAETWRRYQLVLAIYQFHGVETPRLLTRQEIQAYLQHLGQGTNRASGSSVGSIERYVSAWVTSGGDIRSLVPKRKQQGGRGKTRLDETVEKIVTTVLERYARLTERESTLDQVVTEVVNAIADENRYRSAVEQLALPHPRTIRRRIRAAGEQRVLGRQLSRREQKAQAEALPGPRPTRVLERVEIDHTTLDLFVVDERDGLPIGRPHITACIDKHSGLVPGWHIGFNQGGYESIMLCLLHAFLPKPDYRTLYGTEHDYPVYGLFEKLCIDNGRDFKSADLKNALAELGIIREEMPKETPWFKGSIERYFRSVNQRLLKGKPGYSFGNVVQLGDYDAQKDAVISLSAFLEVFHIFMVDIYPYSWHDGLEAIPMQRWQASASLFQPDLFEDTVALKRILLPSAERTLQARGIEWEGNFYRGAELVRLREQHGKERVRFKYNPDDMDCIYVRDSSSPTGWLEWRSTNPDYTRGLSLAKHRVIRQYVNAQQQQVDHFSLARAKAHIQQVVEREFVTTQKLRRRSRLKPLLQPETATESHPHLTLLQTKRPNLSEDETNLGIEMSGWSSDYGLPIPGEEPS